MKEQQSATRANTARGAQQDYSPVQSALVIGILSQLDEIAKDRKYEIKESVPSGPDRDWSHSADGFNADILMRTLLKRTRMV